MLNESSLTKRKKGCEKRRKTRRMFFLILLNELSNHIYSNSQYVGKIKIKSLFLFFILVIRDIIAKELLQHLSLAPKYKHHG